MDDPYTVLGVSSLATEEEISQAYGLRKADDGSGDAYAAAHKILSEPFRRWNQDNSESCLLPPHIKRVNVNVALSLEQMYRGCVSKHIEQTDVAGPWPVRMACVLCKGMGYQLAGLCQTCMGTGQLGHKVAGMPGIQLRECHICLGKKVQVHLDRACPKCVTQGQLDVRILEPLSLVPGAWSPSTRVLAGELVLPAQETHPAARNKGKRTLRSSERQSERHKRRNLRQSQASQQCQARDAESLAFMRAVSVVVTCTCAPHNLFTWVRHTGELVWNQAIEVSLSEVMFGFRRTIMSIEGRPLVFESPRSFRPQSHFKVRIPNQGMRLYGSTTRRGDMVVSLSVQWPVPRTVQENRNLDTRLCTDITQAFGERQHEHDTSLQGTEATMFVSVADESSKMTESGKTCGFADIVQRTLFNRKSADVTQSAATHLAAPHSS